MRPLSINDLNNAQQDIEHIAAIATSSSATTVDRYGNVKPTLRGAINKLTAFNLRGAFASGTAYAMKDVYTLDGVAYVALADHTSSSVEVDLATGKVTIHQGASVEVLASPDGAAGVGYQTGTVADALAKSDSLSWSTNKLLHQRGVKYFAHRGAMQLNPENSIPAFVAAGELGYFAAECDLQITADGEFIILHDETLDRTTDGTGNVTTMTLAQVRAANIDTGSNLLPGIKNDFANLYPNLKVPTLNDYLDVCIRYGMVPVIEAKLYQPVQRVAFVEALKKRSVLYDCILMQSDLTSLAHYRELDKGIALALLANITPSSVANARSLGNAIISCEANAVNMTQVNIDLCHANGVKVNAWVLNNPRTTSDYIRLGIDFVTSDILI